MADPAVKLTKAEVASLIERLLKRAEEDQRCADNSAVVVEAFADQMKASKERTGHNVYAVRMAVDHRNSVKRDGGYASDLRQAAALLDALKEEGDCRG